MFAYCLNNPIKYIDSSGNRACLPEDFDCGSPKEDNIMDKWEKEGVVYISYGKNKGGQIKNSNKITDGKEMTEYATYLVTHSPYKDDISGSVEGVVFEWEVHNWAFLFFDAIGNAARTESARSVDFGNTIFDDYHLGFTQIMWAGYFLGDPVQYHADLTIYLSALKG